MRVIVLSGCALVVSVLPAVGQTSGLGSSGGIRSSGSSGLGGGLNSGGLGSGLGGNLGGSGGMGGSILGSSGIGGSMGSSGGGTGSFLGATSGASSSRTGSSSSQQAGSTTFLGPYFANPLSLGISSNGNSSSPNSNQYTFARPLFNVTGTGGATGSTYLGMAGSGGGLGTATTSTGSGAASSVGVRRAPAYTTTLGFAYSPGPPSRALTEVQRVLGRSERLPSRDNIRVEIDGPAVVLRGSVADEHEARLAEALARLTPGVRELRNELTIRGGGPAPFGP